MYDDEERGEPDPPVEAQYDYGDELPDYAIMSYFNARLPAGELEADDKEWLNRWGKGLVARGFERRLEALADDYHSAEQRRDFHLFGSAVAALAGVAAFALRAPPPVVLLLTIGLIASMSASWTSFRRMRASHKSINELEDMLIANGFTLAWPRCTNGHERMTVNITAPR